MYLLLSIPYSWREREREGGRGGGEVHAALPATVWLYWLVWICLYLQHVVFDIIAGSNSFMTQQNCLTTTKHHIVDVVHEYMHAVKEMLSFKYILLIELLHFMAGLVQDEFGLWAFLYSQHVPSHSWLLEPTHSQRPWSSRRCHGPCQWWLQLDIQVCYVPPSLSLPLSLSLSSHLCLLSVPVKS